MEDAPKSLRAALASPNHRYWREAIDVEMGRFAKYQVLEPVSVLPADVVPIRTHFVFALKTGQNGRPIKFKARCVADGNNQVEGVDWTRSKSDVADSRSLRIVLMVGAMMKWEFFQVDVDSAFLQSEKLAKPIYIISPYGYPTKFARAVKPIYGFVQSGRLFQITLRKSLTRVCGLQMSSVDPGLYFLLRAGRVVLMCVVHVDDFIGCAVSRELKMKFRQNLSSCHDITFTDNPTSILSLALKFDSSGFLHVSIEKYLTECMARYNIPCVFPTRSASFLISQSSTQLMKN